MDLIDIALKVKDKDWFEVLCRIKTKEQYEIFIEDIKNAETIDQMDHIVTQILTSPNAIENIDTVLDELAIKYITLSQV